MPKAGDAAARLLVTRVQLGSHVRFNLLLHPYPSPPLTFRHGVLSSPSTVRLRIPLHSVHRLLIDLQPTSQAPRPPYARYPTGNPNARGSLRIGRPAHRVCLTSLTCCLTSLLLYLCTLCYRVPTMFPWHQWCVQCTAFMYCDLVFLRCSYRIAGIFRGG